MLTIALHMIRDLGFANFSLQIFGGGPLDRYLRQQIARYDLGKYIHVRGPVHHDILLSNLATSDIVCLPSLHEACPVLMIEAMALGKPVVAFDLPFAREMLGDRYDMLLASGTMDFARKLVHLSNFRDDRDGLGRRLKARAHDFEARKIAELYLAIYKRLSE